MLPPNEVDIKVKVCYDGEIMITYVKDGVTYEQLCKEIRMICRFLGDQVRQNDSRLWMEIS